MVRDLRECKYDGVIVVRLDRLGQNTRELAMLVDELKGKGIRALSVKENFDTSTPLGHAMRNHR
jgi:site-specific DNA recombinase